MVLRNPYKHRSENIVFCVVVRSKGTGYPESVFGKDLHYILHAVLAAEFVGYILCNGIVSVIIINVFNVMIGCSCTITKSIIVNQPGPGRSFYANQWVKYGGYSGIQTKPCNG